MVPSDPAARHRAVAGRFTECVLGTRDWLAPTPVAEWRAWQVVEHLTEWFRGFLASGAGIALARGPGAQHDPVGTWQVHTQAVQELFAEPDRTLADPHVGELPVPEAIDHFYTPDVFMHTWDLARATGQNDRLDPDYCAQLLAGMEPIEALMRESGQYGPRVAVPDDADVQTRMLGFIGRDPQWRPLVQRALTRVEVASAGEVASAETSPR